LHLRQRPKAATRQTPFTMAHGTTRARTGLSSLLILTNALIWVSAVIVMGIISYFISLANGTNNSRIIYMEVVSVLTVTVFLVAFFLVRYPGTFLLFNLIFSYLWLVVVVFTAEGYSNSRDSLLLTVEAFSFIAL